MVLAHITVLITLSDWSYDLYDTLYHACHFQRCHLATCVARPEGNRSNARLGTMFFLSIFLESVLFEILSLMRYGHRATN